MTWVVLADPEGNEFCVLSARPSAPRLATTAASGQVVAGAVLGQPGGVAADVLLRQPVPE